MTRPLEFVRYAPLTFVCALPLCARANEPASLAAAAAPAAPGLWREGAHPSFETNSDPKRSEVADGLGRQVNLFAQLRAWRETMRGQGTAARREFTPGSISGEKLKLAIGKQMMPSNLGSWNGLSSAAGAELRFGMFSAGTTQAPGALNSLLTGFDRATQDTPVVEADENSLTWLAAQPLAAPGAKLQFALARGRKDLMLGEGEKWVEGTAMGAHGEWKLPVRWALRTDWTQSQLSGQAQPADAWSLQADGPVVHPWGEAHASAVYTSTATGYATLNAPSPDEGRREGTVSVAQDVAIGPLSGNLKVAATRTRRPDVDSATAGSQVGAQNLEGGANFRLALTPSLAIVGSGSLTSQGRAIAVTPTTTDSTATTDTAETQPASSTDSATSTPASTSGDASTTSETAPATTSEAAPLPAADIFSRPLLSNQRYDLTQAAGGDMGIEYRLSRSLACTFSGGYTRTADAQFLGGDWQPQGLLAENRFGVEVRRHWGKSAWGVKVSRKMWNDLFDEDSLNSDQHATVLTLEGERRLVMGCRLRTSFNWATQKSELSPLAARKAEAQLTMGVLGRLDASYSDGATGTFNLLPNPSTDVTRELNLRYNAGSAAGGKGFGMAVEYQHRELSNSPDYGNWRVGVTFR